MTYSRDGLGNPRGYNVSLRGMLLTLAILGIVVAVASWDNNRRAKLTAQPIQVAAEQIATVEKEFSQAQEGDLIFIEAYGGFYVRVERVVGDHVTFNEFGHRALGRPLSGTAPGEEEGRYFIMKDLLEMKAHLIKNDGGMMVGAAATQFLKGK